MPLAPLPGRGFLLLLLLELCGFVFAHIVTDLRANQSRNASEPLFLFASSEGAFFGAFPIALLALAVDDRADRPERTSGSGSGSAS